ncbi:hypothetical protein VN97_g6811 [Penicillium thymicola]|uniref:Uncharacterized protein n=1 Tax=Penicillium thymicola TaxID=293382 RepID=A0AAI9X755_PENTH|nr:hypothetical protein VN97_g6811 [Penicillium thymicola]
MEKPSYEDRTDVLSAEQQSTTWQTLYTYNRRLKRAIRMLIVLVILFALLFAGFLYLTVQIGRERDLVLHLEQQINEYENHGNAVSKRAIPWFLGAAFWATNQVFAFYGLASSCKSFTESAGNAALCIWGAISTAATFIGTAAHGASTVKQIHDRLAQNGISIGNWKRDDAVSEAEAEMSKLLQLPVTLDGFAPHHHPKLGRMKLAEGTLWPVFHFHNHQKTSMHFTLTAYEEDHAVMTLGFGHKSDNSSITKRESYNDEYFSDGGIDFTDCFNNQQSTYLLNTASDYQQMDRDIECYFPDLANTWGAEIQLYDSNIRGTIGSGSIAAYRGSDHASSISVMPGCPAGVSSSSKCKRA